VPDGCDAKNTSQLCRKRRNRAGAGAGIAFINASAGLYFLAVLFVVSPLLNRLRPFHASFIKWVSEGSEEVAAA
jgi:hypothetical protein